MENQFPSRLYKYREFDTRTLEMLVSDQIYFANPSMFNDPFGIGQSKHESSKRNLVCSTLR